MASSPSDVLSHCSTSDEETDTPNTNNQDPDEDEGGGDSLDGTVCGESSSSSGGKEKKKLPQLQAKPCIKKKVRSQTQAIQEMQRALVHWVSHSKRGQN